MTYQSGSAVGSVLIDLSDVERKRTQFKSIIEGMAQDAANLASNAISAPTIAPLKAQTFPTPDQSSIAAVDAYVASLTQIGTVASTAATPTQQLIADTRALGAAQGQSAEQINAQLAALSREALLVGDLTKALELEDAALGEDNQQKKNGTQASLQLAQAESGRLKAAGDLRGAIQILATELQQQETRTVSVINAEKQLIQLDQQLAQAAAQDAKAIQQQADAELRLAQNQARTLKASGDSSGALNLLTSARNNATNASAQLIASTNTQIAGLERGSTVVGNFTAQFVSLISPIALVGSAMAILDTAVKETISDFKLSAELDASDRSIKLLLADTRDTSKVLNEASQFADKYNFTQKEITGAVSDAIPVIRQSNQGMETILSTFSRLAISKPGKTFNDAARAIGELQSGNVSSLNRIFNVPLDDANKLRKEIEAGGDAVAVVNDYLTRTGTGMEVLEARTQGAQGKMLALANATEKLELARAGGAGGIGEIVLDQRITATQKAAAALRGDTHALADEFQSLLTSANPMTQVFFSVGDADDTLINKFNTLAGTSIPNLNISVENMSNSFKRFLGLATTDTPTPVTARTKDDFVSSKKAIDANNEALTEDIDKKQDSALKTDQLNKLQKYLADIGPQVAGGLYSSADAAAFLSKQYGYTALAAQGVIDKQAEIARVTQATSVLLANQKSNTQSLLPGGLTAGSPALSGANNTIEAVLKLQNANAQLTKAQQDSLLANGTATEKVTVQQDRYNDAVKNFGANSPEAIAAQSALTGAQRGAADATKATLDAQIAYAQSQNDTATARKLLNQELVNAKGNLNEELAIKTRLNELDKKKGVVGGKGISTLDRTDLNLLGDYESQLARVNAILEKGGLTQLQTNQYKIQQRDLQQKINDAKQKELDLQTDIALGSVKDQEARLKETRQLDGLRRAAESGRLTAQEQRAVELRQSEILLEQQHRTNELTDKANQLAKETGKAPSGPTQPLGPFAPAFTVPVGGTPNLPVKPSEPVPVTFGGNTPSAVGVAPITVNLSLSVDASGRGTITSSDANVTLNLLANGTRQVLNTGGRG